MLHPCRQVEKLVSMTALQDVHVSLERDAYIEKCVGSLVGPSCPNVPWTSDICSQALKVRGAMRDGRDVEEEEFNERPAVCDGAEEQRQRQTVTEKSSPSFRLISKD